MLACRGECWTGDKAAVLGRDLLGRLHVSDVTVLFQTISTTLSDIISEFRPDQIQSSAGPIVLLKSSTRPAKRQKANEETKQKSVGYDDSHDPVAKL